MDKHADPLDKAGEIAQMYNDQGVKDVQLRNRPEQQQNPDGSWPITHCADCAIEIPEQRLAWGRIRCTDCQSIKEKFKRGFAP